MKTKIIFSLFLLLFIPVLFISCEQVKNLATVTVTYDVPRIPFTYTPANTKTGEEILCTEQVNLNIDSLLNVYLPGGELDVTTFSKFTITIDEPDTANFNWLQSARAVVSQDAGFTTTEEVGRVDSIAPDAKTIVLTMNNDNIRPLLGTQGFYFRVYGTLNGPVPYEWLQMYIDAQLKLNIQPL